MKPYFILFYISLLWIANAFAQDNPMRDDCGDFRWDVKTLTDSRLGNVDFKRPIRTTVDDQVNRTPPNKLSSVGDISTPRFQFEDTVYTLKAKLIEYKEEYDKSAGTGDHDFHIVLQDLNNPDETIVVEIPSTTDCSCARSSIHAKEFDNARNSFLSLLKANGLPAPQPDKMSIVADVIYNDLMISVEGVGFWDLPGHLNKKTGEMVGHGTGSAINGRELHPVLRVESAK